MDKVMDSLKVELYEVVEKHGCTIFKVYEMYFIAGI